MGREKRLLAVVFYLHLAALPACSKAQALVRAEKDGDLLFRWPMGKDTALSWHRQGDLPHTFAEAMPFFCRIERDLSRRMPLAVKFRLGAVPYVDQLEGKRRWYEY